MKMMKQGLGRRLRYGGVTAALTAAIIAIVIIVNVIFSSLAGKLLWYTDLTPELLFTLSDECVDIIRDGDDKFESKSPIEMINETRPGAIETAVNKAKAEAEAKGETLTDAQIENVRKEASIAAGINIIFCDTDINWENDVVQRYVLETAKQLQNKFPDHINIEFVDIVRNPSRVNTYSKTISPSSVIIESGTEFRVRALRSFYVFDDTTGSEDVPWAYNGEKVFTSAIMAVTRAESPIAGVVAGHGEAELTTAFRETLINAGYKVKDNIDLSDVNKAENNDVRLLIINCPKTDFIYDNGETIDEIEELDIFLDKGNSMMVFMDPDTTGRFNNLEEYLEEWGIKYERTNDDVPYLIKEDRANAHLDGAGFSFFAQVLTGEGLAKDINQEVAGKKVLFSNAMSIGYSDLVRPQEILEDPDDATSQLLGWCGSIEGTNRQIFDLFQTSDKAVAMAGGEEIPAANGNNFKLMTISRETRSMQEDDYAYSTIDMHSYVVASGCPGFVSDQSLNGSYGNTMFLEYTLRTMGHEPVPVGLTFKPFGDYTIDTVDVQQANTLMILYAAIPVVLAAGAGIFVIVRRKNR